MFGFSVGLIQICGKIIVMDKLEKAYEELSSITRSSWSYQVRVVALHDLYDSLGDASVRFDNMVYERLGMSAEEALEMLYREDVLP